MPSFEPGQIVKLPFPYVEVAATKHRPGLVLAVFEDRRFLWVAMVTSAANARWPEDVALANLEKAGLPKASVVRPAKLAMVAFDAAEVIGRCSAAELRKTKERIVALLS
jgi:mRNA interferase MazF